MAYVLRIVSLPTYVAYVLKIVWFRFDSVKGNHIEHIGMQQIETHKRKSLPTYVAYVLKIVWFRFDSVNGSHIEHIGMRQIETHKRKSQPPMWPMC